MEVQKSLSAFAWLLLLLLALIWGGSFLSFAIALRELPVLTIVAIRVSVAATLLWGFVWFRGMQLRRDSRVWMALLVMGLLNNVIPFTLIVWGQTNIESGLASILNASTAIFGVAIAALIFPDERLTGRKLGGSGNLLLVTLLLTPIAIVLGALALGEVLPANAHAGFVVIALGLIVIDGRVAALMVSRGGTRG